MRSVRTTRARTRATVVDAANYQSPTRSLSVLRLRRAQPRTDTTSPLARASSTLRATDEVDIGGKILGSQSRRRRGRRTLHNFQLEHETPYHPRTVPNNGRRADPNASWRRGGHGSTRRFVLPLMGKSGRSSPVPSRASHPAARVFTVVSSCLRSFERSRRVMGSGSARGST